MLSLTTREVTPMKTSAVKGLFSIAVLSISFSAAVFAIDEPVQLTYGQVSGVELDNDVTVFRGIPFAARLCG